MKTNLSIKDELLSAIRRIVAKFWAQVVGRSMRLQSVGYHANLSTKIGIRSRIGSRMLLSTLLMLTICIGDVWGALNTVYTLTPTAGSDNSYAGDEDIDCEDTDNDVTITWNVTGNATMVPWRLGGKSSKGNTSTFNRAIYSKDAISDNVTQIKITTGNATITLNSMTITVSKNSDFSSPVSTLTPSLAANNTVTIDRPDGKNWSNCYYKINYNVSVTGASNKYVEFSGAVFKAESGTSVSLTNGGCDGSGGTSKGSFTMSTSSVTTTSSSGSVTLTCTPANGYETSSVSATDPATHPGSITYGGSGNSRTVTYPTGHNGSSTITVNFSCVTPTFGTNLSTSIVNYAQGAAATALTVGASANNATINYQWQTSPDNSVWTNTGTNSSANTSLTPSTASVGTTYYRCIATNAASGCSATATSNVATVTVTAGSTWKFKYSGDTWATTHTMTESAGVASYSISLAADSRFEFGFDDNGSAFYKNNGTIITTTSGWTFNTTDGNCKIHTGPAGTYTFAINTTSKAVTVTYPTVDHPNDHYVYFKNTNVWGTVYGYLANSGNDNKAAAWPGSVMQATTTICGETYHYAALNAMSGTYNTIIFNNGNSGYGNQTSDLSTTSSLGKYNANQDANWHDFKYTITFAGNGSTGGSMSNVSNICVGSNQTLASNGYSKTHYHFTGWIANVDVKIGGATVTAGTLIANAATIQDIQSNITLTAQWAPDEYTITKTLTNVTSSPAIPSSYTYTGSAAGLTYTISANDGYRLPTSITVSGTTYTWNSATGALVLTGTITSNVSITITAVQTHTVTWLSNGSNHVSPVTYDHGAALVFPASDPTAPSSCSDKVFVGWTSDSEITTETSTEPTLITAGGAVNANATYRAVFADETTSGGGTETILEEPFTGFDNAATPSSPGGSATTLDGSNITYTCTAGTGTGTTATNIQTTGGPDEGNNILIRKKNGAFTINNIPTNSQTSATLTYKWRGTGTIVLSGSSNISLGSISTDVDASSNNTCTVTITINSGATYSLTWTNTHTDNNLRFDLPTITCSGTTTTYDNYITQCCSLKPVTGLTVSGVTGNSVTLTWTAPSPTTGIDHLELRNASTDAKIGSNIAVGTTSATVSDLTECTTYTYKVVSVGATCETPSETVEGTPYSGAKTITYKYHDDVTADGSFTTDCTHPSTTLPNPSRTGYTLNGWYTAASGGSKIGNGGASYEPSADITLHAQWSLTNYTVTMAQTPAISATLTGGTTTANYGNTINISTNVPSGYRFNGWTSSPSVTFANASAASTSFTMPASNVTVTANFVQVHSVSFSVPSGGGTVVSPPSTVDHGGTLTFPNVTDVDCGTFLGWTTAANSSYSSTSGTPAPLYAAAATTTINAAAVFYAVYSKVGDNPVAATLYAHSGGTNTITNAGYTNVTVTTSGLGTYSDASYAVKFDGTSCYAIFQLDGTPTSFSAALKTLDNGASGTSTMTLYESDSPSGPWNEIKSVDCSAHSTTYALSETTAANFSKRVLKMQLSAYGRNIKCGDITINGLRAPITYTTNPSCVDWRLQSIAVTTAPTKTTYDECEEFDPAGMVVTATMKENGNPSNTTTKDVAGYTWTPTQFMTPGNSVAVTISYTEKDVTRTTTTSVRVNDLANYTITFHDGGNTTTWTQSNHCDACNLDSRTGSLACGDYTFAGWSTSSTSYDDQSATITTWVSGSYVPTANTNLYAVYRKGAAPAEFTANCAGGTFTIGTKKGGSTIISRAANTGSFNSYEYGVANSGYTEDQLGKFLFEKVADNTYKISLEREDDYGDGIKRFYVAPDDYSAGSFEFLETYNADQCKWKVVEGTYGTWRIYTEFRNSYVTKDYGIGGRGDEALPRFRLVPTNNINGSDNYDVELTPVATPIYQSNPSCSGTYTITFNTHGGTFVQGDYAYSTETTDGLSETTNSYFPSATMPGCTFVGWKEGSAQEEENSDAPVGLSEEGDALVVSSNKTYHAVYYYFDDDWEFDPEVGGTYHLYYEVSGIKYFVSSTPTDSWAYLSTSSDCTDAKDVVITPGTGVNEGKYSISVDGYTIIPENGGTKFKRGEFWWTFTDRGDGTYAINGMNNNRNIVGNSAGTSMQHVGYNSGSSYSGWYYPSIGRCRQHHWTSDPVLMPLITLGSTGSLNVTSTNGKTVYAANKLTIEATRYGEQTKLYLFSNNANIGFRKGDGTALDADGVGPYIQTDASGELATTNITITYTPNVSTDGIETATITVRDNTSPSVQASATRVIKARHLPTDFVIAAKNTADNKWYALPANMDGTGNPVPVEIAVDDNNNPSIAYTATSNIYNLYSNGTPQYVQLGMKNNVDENSRSYALWANNSSGSNDIGKNTGLAQSDLGGNYQWLLTQTNGSISTPQEAKYTISNPNNANPLKAWFTAGGGPKWGLYVYGEAELRLIPASTVEYTEAEVVAWGQKKLILEIAKPDAATQARAKLGDGDWSTNKTLTTTGTSVKGTATKYNYTLDFTDDDFDFSSAENEGKMLMVELLNGSGTPLKASSVIIPRIIAANRTINKSNDATKGPWNTEVHVLPGVTLTVDASAYDPQTMTISTLNIYPGATVNASNGTLIASTLILRNGWDRLSATKKYDVARLYITPTTGSLQAGTAYSDWYIDFDQYYPIAVPWNVTVANMSYLNSTNAASAGVKLRYYDGESRASNVQSGVGESANWKEYGATGNLSTPATLTPGVGYAMTARRPTGKAFSIIRMPLTIPSAAWTTGGEQGSVTVDDVTTHKDQVSVTAHTNTTSNTPEYAKGWNLIANPFMSLYNGTLNYGENNTIAYANIPDINFQEYSQVPINSTTKLKPSSAFLVQAPITGTATFATDSRVAAAPSYRNAGTATTPTQKAYILLADEQTEDMMGILVSEKYTADYELNADLEKLLSDGNTLRTYMRYNDMNMAYLAINEELAKQLIPVSVRIPADGEYTFRIHEASIADELEGIYLTDYQANTVTNLLYDSYTFNAVAGTDNVRFAINAVIGKREVPTGVDISDSDKDRPTKFIWNDKVYILHNNVIYDSTGKRVNVINK